jgi:2-C-methyl-D-erythritol 4-phosphate cytidylyltransferase/2-C-methyl-D-erythritol 2,4-cyclodiphosphate synthase
LSDLTLILLSAGSSSRFSFPVKKQWLRIGHDPLWLFVTNRLTQMQLFDKVIIAATPDEIPFMKVYTDHTLSKGGSTRQESLKNALEHVSTKRVLVTDIARACADVGLIKELIAHQEHADCIVPYLNAVDTIVYEDETIDRNGVKRIQTPQLSVTSVLKAALNTEHEYTDESSAIHANGGSRHFIAGKDDAHKLTFLDDIKKVPCLTAPSTTTLVGNGLDVHAFEAGKPMVLGGVKIDVDYGLKAHSDGDVAIHALIDALLGAAGMGDIGMLFPDTDEQYKGVDSKQLLEKSVTLLRNFGFDIVNADITIAAQAPRLANYKEPMRNILATILAIPAARVNIKATTTEKLGFVGRKEGVAVMATATLNYFNWMEL